MATSISHLVSILGNDVVPVEPSAAPFRDWNTRICAESYRPNGWARVVDSADRVVSIVNNYEFMSFDLGPTLDRWMQRAAPDVRSRMIEADRNRKTAIAHPFHHVILPLASRRDRLTELRWGRRAFELTFGREPHGVWLPETALDSATLTDVVACGFDFTVVLDHQVRTRPSAIVRHGQCKLVVADGDFSHGLAFGVFGGSAASVLGAARSAAAANGVGIAATDGETFGHHHHFSERTMAYALAVEGPESGMVTQSCESLVRSAGAIPEVDVYESAWSCAHGLGRWQTDCGCSNGDVVGAHQRWRAPLRRALQAVRDVLADVFEEQGRKVLRDPWAARDAFIDVVWDDASTDWFLREHLAVAGGSARALALLDAQRHSLAMFTSCAWFFDDVGRLETALVLQSAAEALRVIRSIGEVAAADAAEAALLGALHGVASAEPPGRTAETIWRSVVATEPPEAVMLPAPSAPFATVERAVINQDPATIDRATAMLAASSLDDLERSQELLFDTLVAVDPQHRLTHPLRELGFAANLAVDELRRY